MLIAIEGLDAAGKATQAKRLAEKLKCKLFSFPAYETEIGDLIQNLLHEQWEPVYTFTDPQQKKLEMGPYLRALLLQSLMTVNRNDLWPGTL